MNEKQIAFHLYCMAIRANPSKCLDKMKLLYEIASCLDIDESLAYDTFVHLRRNEYLMQIAEHSDKFSYMSVPDPSIDELFSVLSAEFQYCPQDNVKMKDQKCLDVAGWCDLNMDVYTYFAGTKENGMSRFVKLMKSKSDVNRRILENCRTSLLDLSAKIYRKYDKQSE